MIRDAVTCDREHCEALYLEHAPGNPPEDPNGVLEFADVATIVGWTYDENGHTCPACKLGTGPVLERGECPACGGRTSTRYGKDTCMYCERELPTPDGDGDDW